MTTINLSISSIVLDKISDIHAIITINTDILYGNCIIEYKTYDANDNVINDWAYLDNLKSKSQTFEFTREVDIEDDLKTLINSIDFRLKLICGNL